MSDEWTEWKSAWDAGARSLPEIAALADKQRRRIVIGLVGMWLIGACLVVSALTIALRDPSRTSTIHAVFQCVVVTSMLTFAHVLMWGNWREPNETPDAMLALMQRRWTVRRRLASFVRWGGLFVCAFTELFCLGVDLGAGRPVWPSIAGYTAFTVGLAIFFWLVSKKQMAKADGALAELDEQRRLLRDSDPGA